MTHQSPEEVVELRALSAFLADKPFLMGAQPCGVDANALASLAGLATRLFEPPRRRRAERYGDLVAYVDRGMARFFLDFPWAVEASIEAVA